MLMRSLGWDSVALAGAARLGTTALVAFALAAALGIANPFWAAMPVWAIAQPTRGMLLEKGALRFLGTLLGAAAGFALLDLAGRQPYLALVLLSLWIAAMATAIPLLRGGLGYGALLSGMTAAIVVLPSLHQPDHSFTLAVSRVECTLIGVAVASLMGFLWTPPAQRLAFYDTVRQLSHDTLQLLEKLFGGGLTDGQHVQLEHALLRKFSEVQSAALLVGAGSRRGYQGIRKVDALITAALEVLAAARALHSRLKQEGMPVSSHPSWSALHGQLEGIDARQFHDTCARIPHMNDRLAAALGELVLVNQTLYVDGPTAEQHSVKVDRFEYLSAHRDPRLAIEAGSLAGLVTGIAGAAVVFFAWPPAVLCALGMSIVSMLLGSHPTPAKIAVIVLKGACAGIGAALIYRMFFQPQATSLPLLILTLLPFLVIGSLARVHPATAAPALDGNLVFLMASHATLSAPSAWTSIWIDSAALTAGIALTCLAFLLLPPSTRKTSRALMALSEDIQKLARSAKSGPQDQALVMRRVLTLAKHSEQSEPFTRAGHSVIAVINAAQALQRLGAIHEALPADDQDKQRIRDALDELRHVSALPFEVANHLSAEAQTLEDQPAANALKDAANAIRSCHAILGHS